MMKFFRIYAYVHQKSVIFNENEVF